MKVELPPNCMGVHPKYARGTTAFGCDVGIARYDLAIADVIRIGELPPIPRLLFYGKLPDEEFCTFVLEQYRSRFGVGDSMPDGTLVLRWQKTLKRKGVKLWRSQYNTTPNPTQIKIVENEQEGILKLDRTLVLDELLWSFQTGMGFLLPQNFREIDGRRFVSEMTAATRVPVNWHGHQVNRWEGPPDDHAMHALTFLRMAIEKSDLGRFGGSSTIGPTQGLVDRTMGRQRDDEDDDAPEELYLEA